jgi:hypothetical protein
MFETQTSIKPQKGKNWTIELFLYKLMHSSKNCFFIILPRSFFLNIGTSNFYLDGNKKKCNKNIYKIKVIWMRRVKVFTEVIE